MLVDGVARAKSFRLAGGEAVEAALREPGDLPAEPGPLDVRFEDEHLLVLSKPPEMAVHPTAARREGTLVNRLLGNGIALFPGDDSGPSGDRPPAGRGDVGADGRGEGRGGVPGAGRAVPAGTTSTGATSRWCEGGSRTTT